MLDLCVCCTELPFLVFRRPSVPAATPASFCEHQCRLHRDISSIKVSGDRAAEDRYDSHHSHGFSVRSPDSTCLSGPRSRSKLVRLRHIQCVRQPLLPHDQSHFHQRLCALARLGTLLRAASRLISTLCATQDSVGRVRAPRLSWTGYFVTGS